MLKPYMWGYRAKGMRIGPPIDCMDAQTIHVGLQIERHEDWYSYRMYIWTNCTYGVTKAKARGIGLQSTVWMHKLYMWGYRLKDMRIETPIGCTDAQTVHVVLQSQRHEDRASNRIAIGMKIGPQIKNREAQTVHMGGHKSKDMRIGSPSKCTDAQTVHVGLQRMVRMHKPYMWGYKGKGMRIGTDENHVAFHGGSPTEGNELVLHSSIGMPSLLCRPIKEERMDLDYLCDRELVQESYDQGDENVINFGVQTKGDEDLMEISAEEYQESLTLCAP
ncbi:OLC1v1005198C1 [Oldenlandia corymbosa var. corymbosa]|uniref:OLC1v1005198C1 n=1 Tax=Oldenlandia corymbosa var. corymbosa TaxID=529605 RepID=A0AAV1DE65_OLDCO|nr:OLC1v1005198C1 [Oldenlandia corymbosa var. corymbosa]